jgi:O-antigen ligase
VMALVGLLVSPNYQASLPRFFGILFQIGVYVAIVSSLRTTRLGVGQVDRLWSAAAVYAVLGVLVATVSLLLTMPALSRWEPLVRLYEARPELPVEAQSFLAKVGLRTMHPNRVADVLTLFLPLYLALLLHQPWRGIRDRGALGAHGVLRRLGRSRWLLPATGLALAWAGLVFLATLSRAGYAGMAISVIFLLAYRWPRVRLGIRSAAFGLVLLGGLLVVGPSRSSVPAEAIEVVGQGVNLARSEPASGSFAWRLELWPMVIELIVRHPWTGIGLSSLMPYIEDRHNAHHAHNQALQVALDLGIPGLVCFLAMLKIALASAYGALRDLRGTPHQALAAGIAGALLAFLVATLADIVPPGSKSGVFFWALLGLAVCLPRVHPAVGQEPPGTARPVERLPS